MTEIARAEASPRLLSIVEPGTLPDSLIVNLAGDPVVQGWEERESGLFTTLKNTACACLAP